METSNIKIYADYQRLTVRSGIMRYASDTVNYVRAEFELGNGWQGFDVVQAIWKSRYDTVSSLLDENGVCMVPQEVLARRSRVQVNLVGFTANEGSLTARLTSYPAFVLDVDVKAELYGNRPEEITPTQFERFVGQVAETARLASESASNASSEADRAQASASSAATSEISALNSMAAASDSEMAASESALSASGSADSAEESAQSANTDATRAETAAGLITGMNATANTLAPGSQATASYSDGLLTLGIPQGLQGIRGEKGEKGDRGDAGDVDTAMSSTSTLPVQNKIIKAYVDGGLSAKADASSVPTKVSELTNDAGYLTSYTETDPTVPSWAKASSKPIYTASEVGAVPRTRTVNGKELSSNIRLTAADIGAVERETDPLFTSSAAYGITTTDIDHWDSGYIELDTTATSGEDYLLYTAITAQGWTDSIV